MVEAGTLDRRVNLFKEAAREESHTGNNENACTTPQVVTAISTECCL